MPYASAIRPISTWEMFITVVIYKCIIYFIIRLANNKVLVYCGPGNNGGDGLVCARHLALFGYEPTVVYVKQTNKELFKNLLHQCERMGVSVVKDTPTLDQVDQDFGVVVDALFGFSFKPPVREEFTGIMNVLRNTKVPIAR